MNAVIEEPLARLGAAVAAADARRRPEPPKHTEQPLAGDASPPDNDSPLKVGTVYLVGAGPGDPELLTLKAARLLATADVIVFDALVGPGILELARADVELHYVGKQAARHSLPQSQINQLLVKLAQEGKAVVRLKGGDPFIFGRGGEEVEELVDHQVPFEVVPGVTAASGMAAYAGIPLTHRDFAQSCTFVTGHLKDGSCDLDWPSLARAKHTLVIYMGVGGLAEISRQLMTHHLPAETPAALVENASRPEQRCVVTTLAELANCAARAQVKPPALVVIGQVVRLHGTMSWFGQTARP